MNNRNSVTKEKTVELNDEKSFLITWYNSMSFVTSLSDLGVILCWFVDILIIAGEMKEI